MQGLTKLYDTTWERVFEVWKNAEGSDPNWQRVAKEKGFESWEAWRRNSLSPLEPETREWEVYKIDDVMNTVPKFRVGPYPTWQNLFTKKNVHTFADLVTTQPEWVAHNRGVQSRANHFPESTQFIGVYLEDENVVVLIEGHHRATAVALAVAQGTPVQVNQKPTIALATMSGDEKTALEKILARGTGKQIEG